jgi:phosphopantothenoylcysteine decarboxylase / phosphopantothenate---cysteine ligase
MSLKGKKIILGITGSIAAYKIPYLVRLLKKEGTEVQVILTPSACDFVTPLTLSTLSQRPVMVESFNPVDGAWNSHVEMGNWADLMIIAPVSANTLGKMAHGIVDNLLLTTYLAAKCPVFFAPAMDLDMYHHPSTQENIRILQSFGNKLIAPNEGELASGLCGAGRMEEPEEIVKILSGVQKKKETLKGKKVLVTAGPTYEPIDPVRFIGNYSSGLMGFEIARESALRGAIVTLICGPVNQETQNPLIKRIDVKSASDMHREVMKHFPTSDITIMAAAVADFTPEHQAQLKIKKQSEKNLDIKLKPTFDILAGLGKLKKKNQVLAGFALETDNEESHAIAKLKNKNCDIIVLNSLKDKGAGFGYKTNRIKIFTRKGKSLTFGLKPKNEVAADILNEIEKIAHK